MVDELTQELEKIDSAVVRRALKEMEARGVSPSPTIANGNLVPMRWLAPYIWLRTDERRYNLRPMTGITTGLKALDMKLRGGWQNGSYYAVMGLQKSGKTRVLANFLLAAAKAGHTAVLAEIEVQAEDIYEMMAGMESGVSPDAIALGGVYEEDGTFVRNLTDEEYTAWYRGVELVGTLPIRVIEGALSVDDIEAELLKLERAGQQVAVLFVDYLQKLKGRGERYDSISGSSTKLRQLSLAFGPAGAKRRLPVITALQANRSVHESADKRVQPHMALGTSSIESDVTHMFGIYRRGMWLDVADRPTEDDLELDILLNRSGSVGRIYTKMWMPTGKIYPPPKKQPTDSEEF